ncbi:hypothetical protein, partial [Halodurantibacterium flavum]
GDMQETDPSKNRPNRPHIPSKKNNNVKEQKTKTNEQTPQSSATRMHPSRKPNREQQAPGPVKRCLRNQNDTRKQKITRHKKNQAKA